MLGRKVSECGWESEGDRGKGVVLVLSILVMAIRLYAVHNAQIFQDRDIWQFNIESIPNSKPIFLQLSPPFP